MDAVIEAGLLRKEDSFGNALLDAYHFFSHPQDQEIKLLRLIKDLGKGIEDSISQTGNEKAEIIQRIAAILSRKKPSWIDQSFSEILGEVN